MLKKIPKAEPNVNVVVPFFTEKVAKEFQTKLSEKQGLDSFVRVSRRTRR